jgi:drug/metabolite transporter (DMT)-like permease
MGWAGLFSMFASIKHAAWRSPQLQHIRAVMSDRISDQPAPRLRFWDSPGALLVAVGALLGCMFPLGKLATSAGVPPLAWACVIAAGAAVALAAPFVATGRKAVLDLQHLRYFGVTALVSYAIPNVLVFSVIPKLGSGYTAILYTLSPMLTVALATLFRLRSPSRLELAGIGIGFAGAMLVATGRGEIGRPVDLIWLAIGLFIPFCLALGNVYRTVAWPSGTDPLWLAIGSNAVATAFLAAAAGIIGGPSPWPALLSIPGVAVLQVASSAAMFALYFRLQAVGGPVTLSQIGTVAAAFGVAVGTIVLGENYAAVVWFGVAVIVAGTGLTILARTQR